MEYPNWFEQSAKGNFELILKEYAGKPDLKFLQLGVYTGDASVWLLDNILTDPSSTLNDVDTWQGSDEDAHKSMDFDDVYKTYLDKIKDYKIDIRRTTTTGYLLAQYGCDRPLGEVFDFIYIDADHTTVGVLMDAELSWGLLKPGGIMAFDDYTWGADMSPELTPTLGIDLFLARREGEYETLVVNEQFWVRKR